MNLKVFSVPRAGIEPARLAALVFETNASTNSAIWAFCRCKGRCFPGICQTFIRFFARHELKPCRKEESRWYSKLKRKVKIGR